MESKMGTMLVREAPLNMETRKERSIPVISLPL